MRVPEQVAGASTRPRSRQATMTNSNQHSGDPKLASLKLPTDTRPRRLDVALRAPKHCKLSKSQYSLVHDRGGTFLDDVAHGEQDFSLVQQSESFRAVHSDVSSSTWSTFPRVPDTAPYVTNRMRHV